MDGVYYYEISTAEELAYIAQTGGGWLRYNYILKNDIVLNSAEIKSDDNGNLITDSSTLKKWTPIGNSETKFTGKFDGNGFSVSGVYVDVTSGYAGFLGCVEGTPKNLTVKNSCVKGTNYVGGIAGYTNCSSIINCTNNGSVIGTENVGGIMGFYEHSLFDEYCFSSYNFGSVQGTNYVGGIVGNVFNYNLANCYNVGNVVGETNVGGVAGYSDSIWGKGTVSGCIYLKTGGVNSSLNGFGNSPDVDGVVNAKLNTELCINKEKSIISIEHTYNTHEDVSQNNVCEVCGYNKESGILYPEADSNVYIDTETNTMPKVVANTTAETIILNLSAYGITVTITDKDGNRMESTAMVGTGFKVTDQNGNTYTVIVKGDVDGSGEIDITDYLKIKAHFLEIEVLEGIYFTVADIDESKEIDVTDYLKLKSHFLSTSNIYE